MGATTTPITPPDSKLAPPTGGDGGASSSASGTENGNVTITPTVTITSARRYPKSITPVDDRYNPSQQLAVAGGNQGVGVNVDEQYFAGAGQGVEGEEWVTISEVHLMITDPEGELHRVTFDFDHSEDTPAIVARELVEVGLVPAETNVQILEQRITSAVALASGGALE